MTECAGWHCYCQRVWVGNVAHHQCCMCDHRVAVQGRGGTGDGDALGRAPEGTAAPIPGPAPPSWVWRQMAADLHMIHLTNQGQCEADAGLLTSIAEIKVELGDNDDA